MPAAPTGRPAGLWPVGALQLLRRRPSQEADMPKLTDTQLVILSAAAQRDDRLVLPLPKSLKLNGGAIAAVLKSLLKKSLLEEAPAGSDAPTWRQAKDGQRLTLILTEAGLHAIDGPAPVKTAKPNTKSNAPTKKSAAPKVTAKPKDKAAVPAARPGSKQALLIDMLQRKSGASVNEISDATGWQLHSVRGAISGTLKKKLGLTVASEKVGSRGRVYRIVAEG
jgi:DNA-binding MarR family transcriptional regulator